MDSVKRTVIPHSGLVQFFAERHFHKTDKWLEVEVWNGLISIHGPSSDHRNMTRDEAEVMCSLLAAAVAEVDNMNTQQNEDHDQKPETQT